MGQWGGRRGGRGPGGGEGEGREEQALPCSLLQAHLCKGTWGTRSRALAVRPALPQCLRDRYPGVAEADFLTALTEGGDFITSVLLPAPTFCGPEVE